MQTVIENENLVVKINHFGAELNSIVNKKTGVEYLFDADEKYWKRSAPVLFPFVGSLKNKEYIYDGKKYTMGQHGFARDNEFNLINQKEDEAWFAFAFNEKTLEVYPFKFRLEIGYKLENKTINVFWRVINLDNKTIYYSIGGHPAFMCPLNNKGKQTDYSIKFDTENSIIYGLLSNNGLLTEKTGILDLNNNMLRISENLFDNDALIIENNQANCVGLVDPEGNEYLTVEFDAPLFGLWSPAKKNAPFVCIEPWYGRCDKEDFDGMISEREYSEKLETEKSKEYKYKINIC